MSGDHPVPGGHRQDLRADCGSCFGLCCVAPAFWASADFAIDKPAGHACTHLDREFRCSIHDRLRDRGFPGCTVYDCFGAGQKVSQVSFGGQDWRSPGVAERMFAAFGIMRQLHELLWYLDEALTLRSDGALHGELRVAIDEIERLAGSDPDVLVTLDVAPYRHEINTLLLRTSEAARAGVRRPEVELRGADLIGRDFRRADLRGANLRGALLVGADLGGADLAMADVTGADLRGADLRAANLATTLFLTQSQLDAAQGDHATKLPRTTVTPRHWLRATGSGDRPG